MIPPFSTAESLRASGKELIKPGEYPGDVSITKSDDTADYSSCALAPDKDTVMTASYDAIPIDY